MKNELKLEIGKARDEAFDHTDRKAAEVILEIGKKLNLNKEPDKGFKKGLLGQMV